ncbi:SOAT protein, partial [Polypterus senegalus]
MEQQTLCFFWAQVASPGDCSTEHHTGCCGRVKYKVTKKMTTYQVGSILGWLIIAIVTVISVVLFKGSWVVDTSVLIIGIIYPIIGYVSGFGLAFLLRQPWKRCRTICLETGAQNIQVCATVLQTSFTPKQLVLMFSFPLIYCSFQFLHGVIFVIAYQLYKRKFRKVLLETSVQEEPNKVSEGNGITCKDMKPIAEIFTHDERKSSKM